MRTVNPATARAESRTRQRRVAVAAGIAVALLAGLGVKLWRDHRAPSPAADIDSLSRYMASRAFADLPDAQRAPYLDAFQRARSRGELTPEQQRGVNRNVEVGGEKDPIQRYFSLPLKERQKFLDDVIDRADRSDKSTLPQDKDGPPEMPGDSRHLADATSPYDRARMAQFMEDLHDRRLARGLPDNGKFLLPRAD